MYVSLSAVLVSLTAQWFHVVFQVASRNKIRQRQHVSLKRLSSDLRTDLISASDFSLTPPQQLSLNVEGKEEIIYRISQGQVDRIVGDAQKPARQDVYRDLDDLRLEFVDGNLTDTSKIAFLNVYRPAKRKKLDGAAPQSVAEKSLMERPLLQVRCRPNSNREAVE